PRTVIPGLNDSHLHAIRAGLFYNLELRWDGVGSLSEALDMVREQAKRTPKGQWVRVVGGWSEFQFLERRMPTLDEVNQAAPDTPTFILHLYDRAFLNRAALAALGINRDTPNPPGGEIERDSQGDPTGLLLAKPNALILYSAISKAPKLSYEDQLDSTKLFLRELNRFGLTSAIDAGGGGQAYPNDYRVACDLARKGELTLRIAYYLFAQQPKRELSDFSRWVDENEPFQNDDFFRPNGFLLSGAGENLLWSAADFENFLEPRPVLEPSMAIELKKVVELLVRHRWPFRIHGTYDESITRFLDVFEEVDREVPFNGLRWIIDHAETISERNLQRIRALGGGIAVQDRLAFQGEHFLARYGAEAASQAPPIKRMLSMGLPVGAGTDATRVASYNPWVSLYWLISGKTAGGVPLYPPANRLDRLEALRLYTVGSAWFSGEEEQKGKLEPGFFADFAVLSDDYLTVPEDRIPHLESVLTAVGGKVVYGAQEFERFSPPPLPVSPDWSPVAKFGGYHRKT
ncbi:MAG TPA: amidohydrolase, partial [Chroococcales cyanobacterium]